MQLADKTAATKAQRHQGYIYHFILSSCLGALVAMKKVLPQNTQILQLSSQEPETAWK